MKVTSDTINKFPYQIILGSASPRRKQLMEGLGFFFSVNPIDADESFPPELKADEIPYYLSKKKSEAYPDELNDNDILITADTIVWCNNEVLNKPADFEEGKKMLQTLSGNAHEVYTGVYMRGKHKIESFVDCSKVYFKKLSDDEIEYYLKNYKPYDKAGSYGVQDWIGYIGIEKIEGSFYNVMGLPVKLLYEQLISF